MIKRALKVYDHNTVCTVLLLSIKQTLRWTGKPQKLLSLLQTITVVYQKRTLCVSYGPQITGIIGCLSENSGKSTVTYISEQKVLHVCVGIL